MTKIQVEGGKKLTGTISISGAKNSTVALIPAAILCDEEVTLTNVPNVSDVEALEEILLYLNVGVSRNEDKFIIDGKNLENREIPEELARKLRASYYFMGSLLGKYKKVDMYFPGGCVIGKRPINLHLEGFEKLGAKIFEDGDHFVIEASELVGTDINLDFPSVGATINLILAAVKAKGKTVITTAAKEPEIVNVIDFLNSMGAKINGAGTDTITIEGVDYLHKTTERVIPDRIEAGTYVIIGALTGENLKIDKLNPDHLVALTDKLIEAGANLEIGTDYIIANKVENLKAVDVETQVYPGFATDFQQLMVPFLTQCEGVSTVLENIFENRFQNVGDTNKMGANIVVSEDNKKATIKGVTPLYGKDVCATDLRGGASMLICGLIAEGTTTIDNIKYILRGYNDVVNKLINVGAHIKLID